MPSSLLAEHYLSQPPGAGRTQDVKAHAQLLRELRPSANAPPAARPWNAGVNNSALPSWNRHFQHGAEESLEPEAMAARDSRRLRRRRRRAQQAAAATAATKTAGGPSSIHGGGGGGESDSGGSAGVDPLSSRTVHGALFSARRARQRGTGIVSRVRSAGIVYPEDLRNEEATPPRFDRAVNFSPALAASVPPSDGNGGYPGQYTSLQDHTRYAEQLMFGASTLPQKMQRRFSQMGAEAFGVVSGMVPPAALAPSGTSRQSTPSKSARLARAMCSGISGVSGSAASASADPSANEFFFSRAETGPGRRRSMSQDENTDVARRMSCVPDDDEGLKRLIRTASGAKATDAQNRADAAAAAAAAAATAAAESQRQQQQREKELSSKVRQDALRLAQHLAPQIASRMVKVMSEKIEKEANAKARDDLMQLAEEGKQRTEELMQLQTQQMRAQLEKQMHEKLQMELRSRASLETATGQEGTVGSPVPGSGPLVSSLSAKTLADVRRVFEAVAAAGEETNKTGRVAVRTFMKTVRGDPKLMEPFHLDPDAFGSPREAFEEMFQQLEDADRHGLQSVDITELAFYVAAQLTRRAQQRGLHALEHKTAVLQREAQQIATHQEELALQHKDHLQQQKELAALQYDFHRAELGRLALARAVQEEQKRHQQADRQHTTADQKPSTSRRGPSRRRKRSSSPPRHTPPTLSSSKVAVGQRKSLEKRPATPAQKSEAKAIAGLLQEYKEDARRMSIQMERLAALVGNGRRPGARRIAGTGVVHGGGGGGDGSSGGGSSSTPRPQPPSRKAPPRPLREPPAVLPQSPHSAAERWSQRPGKESSFHSADPPPPPTAAKSPMLSRSQPPQLRGATASTQRVRDTPPLEQAWKRFGIKRPVSSPSPMRPQQSLMRSTKSSPPQRAGGTPSRGAVASAMAEMRAMSER